MISYVKGELAAIEEQKAIIDVGGIGYGVFMPHQALAMLPSVGNEVKLYTYLNVREDAMQLFGFLTKDDLEIIPACDRSKRDRAERRFEYFVMYVSG